ncbi:carboxylate-amine ligase [Humibacillus xanthopallidus]|uniref:Putative glutamate--cysteine ligase 2 n=1 Tax=Humibacillus xanthopallidus TaxID=412689 RepID=A0A543HX32_9MICO|nr:YbdK family carboxylate-amine ligase [Humibacillus xanthopallidus]TQM62886.1 carboxylate-amine ligase [Humibacillus xanthopallidus]
MRTVGVEEEFLLLWPDGTLAPAAPDVLRLVGDSARPGQVKPELMTFQIETASTVSRDLTQLQVELAGLREMAGEAAQSLGVSVVASGVSPFAHAGLTMLTDAPRYQRLAARFPTATAVAGGTCACHVHVGIDDRDLGVQVLARLRRWLPTLLAISGNSPFANGADIGWDSLRYGRQLTWPTFRSPPVLRTADSYDRIVTALCRTGAVLDPRNVYFLARLSPRYPTLEVRIADTCLTTRDAVLLAALVRALVTRLADDVRFDRPSVAPPAATDSLGQQLLTAAHHGVSSTLSKHRPAPTRATVAAPMSRLVDAVLPALETAGDAKPVLALLEERRRIGTGAQRQRNLWGGATSREAFVSALADATRPRIRCPHAASTSEQGSPQVTVV